MGTTMNITKMSANMAPRTARRLADAWPEAMPRGLFAAALLERQFSQIARDEFPGIASPAQLARLGEPILVRSDRASDEVEALLRLPGDTLALVDTSYANVSLEVAGNSRDGVDEAVRILREALASTPPAADRTAVAFWMRGQRGGEVRHRQIEAPVFDAIAGNYTAAVRRALARLVAIQAPEHGRLILWRGEPGTGKSHALRALVRAWAPWCSAHFIIDPEELFGSGGAYMLDVLTWDGDDKDRWRLVILEDAGELIASDARSVAGQALSRLLNVADGLLGQGTRTVVLITTNEPVKRLHPATRRPGRCLADIEFASFSIEEANAWLQEAGQDQPVDRRMTLAELYSHPEHGPTTADDTAPGSFGFARALDEIAEPVGSRCTADRPVSSAARPVRPERVAREYDELRLRFDVDNGERYRVLTSTRSAEVHGSFELPFSELEIENFVLRATELTRPRAPRTAAAGAPSRRSRDLAARRARPRPPADRRS